MILRILLVILLLGLMPVLACTDQAPHDDTDQPSDDDDDNDTDENPSGDGDVTPSDGDSTDDDDDQTDGLVLYGTGGQEGNPAIVRIGLSTRFLDNPDARIQWNSLRLRVTGLNFAQETLNQEDLVLDIVGVAEFELAQANNIRIEARIPSETPYRALALSLDESLPALFAEGSLPSGQPITLKIPLTGIGFWPSVSPLSLVPNSRQAWVVALDAEKLVPESLLNQWNRKAGAITISEEENPKWLPLIQNNLMAAFGIYIDSNQNGLLDRSEDTLEGRLASSIPDQSGQLACEDSDDCPTDQRCYFGICLPEIEDESCESHQDCLDDQRCNPDNGHCEAIEAPWTSCNDSDDCASDELCIYHICLDYQPCEDGGEPCPTGLRCDDTLNLCMPGPTEDICCDNEDNDRDGIVDEGCICSGSCQDHGDCAPPMSLCLNNQCTSNPIACLNDEQCADGCHCGVIPGIPREFGQMCLFDMLDLPCIQ